MVLNKDYMLLQRKGKMILTLISGVRRPFAVTELDLLLLSFYWHSSNEQEITSAFLNHAWVKALLPNVTASQVEIRLQQLNQADVLVTTPKTEQSLNARVLSECSMSGEQLPAELCVSAHAAVLLGDEGFLTWSAKHQCHYHFTVEAVIALMSFGEGASLAQVMEDKAVFFSSQSELALLAQQLFAAGILVSKKTLSSAAEEELPQFSSETPGADISAKSWQQLMPDQRIPVYFVPHMENHFPLALGVLFSALKHYEDGALLQHFQLIPLNFLEPADLLNGPYRKFGPGVWLFSNYMWSLELNIEISDAIKKHDKRNLTIHGGPSTPDYAQACEDFMQQHQSVDIAAHGEGEVTITEIFANLSRDERGDIGFDSYRMSAVAGITFRDDLAEKLIRTPSRPRMKEPDSVPSPYLSGYFDGYGGRVEAAIIETNRGCPYGCTFCDWGSATNQKIRVFDLERVKAEIDWIGRNNVRVMWIADANYGLYDRDIDISRFIVETKQRYGFPQEVVVNYTKNSTWRLVEIIKVFTEGGIISQGIISIQTTDEKTLEVINRKNIRTERYDELAKIFSDLKLPLSTDLMLGLPGITVDAFNKDLQRYIDMDVSVKAYPTQLLPNSPMADPDYIAKYKIEVDENNYLISSFSYTEQDLRWMKQMYQIYTMADGYSLLRYVIRYLQWQYDIRAIDFLQAMLKFVTQEPSAFPAITWAVHYFNHDKSLPGGWNAFYQQVSAFITQQYGIEQDSAMSVVLQVNQYSMPDDSLTYPLSIELQHDFVSYFSADDKKSKPLAEYGPAQFVVSDPNKMVSIDMNYLQYDSHQYFWELHSVIARPKSVSEFAETA
ncbi:MAG: radical SAM protein [Pseudomonadota bacterium]